MSATCERYEVLVSTWLDESLDRSRQRELLDHLTRCAACRRFYLEARALEGLVAVVEPRGQEEAPEAVWERIERRARRRGGSGKPLVWLAAAAAALAVGVALTWIPWPGLQSAAAEPIEILLEEHREDMTEERFVELTTELLQADRKYHFAMQDVMRAVIESSWEGEGATSEGSVEEAGDDEGDNRANRIRT